jgi:hypothetical protein
MIGARFLRRLFGFAAAVQILLPSAASIGDGLLQRETGSSACAAAHVEVFGSKSCKPIHADDCALCRVVTATASPARTPALPSVVASVGPVPSSTASERLRAAPHGLPASRAPPRLDGAATRV